MRSDVRSWGKALSYGWGCIATAAQRRQGGLERLGNWWVFAYPGGMRKQAKQCKT
jgi:hypothetical protein